MKNKPCNGFSLLEVLIAVVIITTCMLAIAAFQTQAISKSQKQLKKISQILLLQSQKENQQF